MFKIVKTWPNLLLIWINLLEVNFLLSRIPILKENLSKGNKILNKSNLINQIKLWYKAVNLEKKIKRIIKLINKNVINWLKKLWKVIKQIILIRYFLKKILINLRILNSKN